MPDPTDKANQVLSNDGNGFTWQALGGDVSGRPGAVTVTGLGGRKLGSLTPLDGQFLKWNATSQQWEATTLAGAMSVFGRTGAIVAQTGDYTFPQIAGSVSVGQLPGAGGDLSGTLTGARVTALQNRPVANSVPVTGQVLAWDWCAVGAAVICRKCDQSVRTYRVGNLADWRLFLLADLGGGGQRTVAGRRGRPERRAERSHGGGNTKPAGCADTSIRGTGVGVERVAVDTAGSCRRERDEPVRTHRNGNGADRRL